MTNDLLIEIGTEELPPKALQKLRDAFAGSIERQLGEQELSFSELKAFATPRRLAITVSDLQIVQADKNVERRGPALQAAFDDQGEPTRAALGFAKSCGVEVSDLGRVETAKGTWLVYQLNEPRQHTIELIPDMVNTALNKLPVPRRMRWGDSNIAFVRPVHWVVLLFGDQLIDADILSVRTGQETFGHRFHHPQGIRLDKPKEYSNVLRQNAYVMADFEERRDLIAQQVRQIGHELDGEAIIDPNLLDEVTGLVEWPVAISGEFDEAFLDLPKEVLISTMKSHQKYFHVVDANGKLMRYFITVSNIQSSHPETVKQGNQRVIRPRLSDSAHFWKTDLNTDFSVWQKALESVVFQKDLGTLAAKSSIMSKIATNIAHELGSNNQWAVQAALMSKCDLISDMVGEFPDLQGIMGRYYAQHHNLPDEVAEALDEQYLPRYAGDRLPATKTGISVSLADKLFNLVGIFAIGQPPTGDKDPFALRRSALGCLRIIIEQKLDIDLYNLLIVVSTEISEQASIKMDRKAVDDVYEYMHERLRAYYLDQGVAPDVYAAVAARRPARPYDFDRRIHAVKAFNKLPEAESLAAANKRIGNILKKQQDGISHLVDTKLFNEDAEKKLNDALQQVSRKAVLLIEASKYTEALAEMALLRQYIDNFFDQVMVMCEDEKLKLNRLALLAQLRGLFMEIADISKLQS